MSPHDETDETPTKEHDVTRLSTAYAAWRRVTLAGALLSGAAIFAMMLFIAADVLRRNLLGGSIPGSFEISQNYLMPLSVFPGLAYVYGSGALPKMDFFTPRLRAVRRQVVLSLLVLESVLLAVVTVYTWSYATDGMERGVSFPAGGDLYTLWPFFFLVPIGFAMVLVEVLFAMTRNVVAGRADLTFVPHEHAQPSGTH